MKKIKELLPRIAAKKKELAQSNSLEEKTLKSVRDIPRSNIAPEIVRQKILDARLSLDLVRAEISKIEEPLDKDLEDLASFIMNDVSTWNSAVGKAREAVKEQIIQSNLQYWENQEADCRRWWRDEGNFERMPIFSKYREAIYSTEGLSQQIRRDPIRTANDFLAHVERHSPKVKINPSTLE